MTDIAIRVENLSKLYHLGALQQRPDTLRDALVARLRRTDRSTAPRATHSNDLWALKDVSFEIGQGEAVGVIGRNGAGKSTLLKILSRITEPTGGYAKIHGRVGSLLEVGTGFHPELTGRENIYLNGAILGMRRTEIDRQFADIVAFAEIERFLNTPVKRYSSGMYVRLAFAVAAHLEPEILLVDEVLAVGDAAFQKKAIGKMGNVVHEGRSVLFVSHNMTAIKSLCSKALMLENGEICYIGSPVDTVDSYLHSAQSLPTSRSWVAPELALGDHRVRLKSVTVVPHSDEPVINVRTPVDLKFEVRNHQQDAHLNFSVVLYTSEEVCVFNTASTPQQVEIGLYSGICHVPGNFLNAEVCSVRLLIVLNGKVILDDPGMVSFEVVDVAWIGKWHGKWLGAVWPQFAWTTRTVRESS